MLFPGVKKVRDKFNLSDDGKFVKGTVRNSRVRLCDGRNCKILHIAAPQEISEETRAALEKFSQAPYKAKVQIDTQSVTYTFREIFAPYSWKKICDVLEGTSKIIFDANPNLEAPQEEAAPAELSAKAYDMKKMLSMMAAVAIAVAAPYLLKEVRSFKYAADLARSIQAECPTQLDEITTLDSATSSLFKVYMNYTVTDPLALNDEAALVIKENFIANLRENDLNKELFEKTIWFLLNYNDPSGNQILQIKIVPVDYK